MPPFDHADRLNRSMPAARRAMLGTWLYDLTNTVNAIVAAGGGPSQALLDDVAALRTRVTALVADVTALRTALNGALTKLDADTGVTDTNYSATLAAPAITATAAPAATATVAGGLPSTPVTLPENRPQT